MVLSKRTLLKVGISLLAGITYWILFKMMSKLMNFDAFVKGTVNYVILPGIISVALLCLLKERSYRGLIYSGILVFIFYFVDLIENFILISSVYNPFKATYLLFIRVGVYSLISAILTGFLPITINKWLYKRRNNLFNPMNGT